MTNVTKNLIVDVVQTILRPIAAILLRCGMTWKEFAEVSKSVFVDVATREFGISGRPTNVSRVSILTGIGRKEVKRQRDLLAATVPVLPTKTRTRTLLIAMAIHYLCRLKTIHQDSKRSFINTAVTRPNKPCFGN